jgi:hypothetical protein
MTGVLRFVRPEETRGERGCREDTWWDVLRLRGVITRRPPSPLTYRVRLALHGLPAPRLVRDHREFDADESLLSPFHLWTSPGSTYGGTQPSEGEISLRALGRERSGEEVRTSKPQSPVSEAYLLLQGL